MKAKVGQSSPLALNSAQLEDAKEFVSSLETYKSTDDAPNSLELAFEIEKHISEEAISIFSLPAFATALQGKTLPQLHAAFNVVCRSEKHFFIQLLDGSQSFETISLRLNASKPIDRDLRRDELLAKRKDLCHFDGCISPFLPEDYRLIKQSDQTSLNEVFDRLCLMAILAFVADVSSLTDDGKFTFKLNGYRSVTGEITGVKISTKLADEFFKIYQWVYADDHAADKLGLARNIISLHWKGTTSEPFEDGVYQSILSGYDVYLKKHVDQYIAIKNKLSDYLSDFSQKSAKLADSVIEKLPSGYDQLLGKWFAEGTELSVGEWQRIALARAFLRQAPLILLDEPTSAMDPWAEADWLARLRELARGKTAILITHRFTTATAHPVKPDAQHPRTTVGAVCGL